MKSTRGPATVAVLIAAALCTLTAGCAGGGAARRERDSKAEIARLRFGTDEERKKAAQDLVRREGAGAIGTLTTLFDPGPDAGYAANGDDRLIAVYGLGLTRHPDAVEPLVHALHFNSSDEQLRKAAWDALSEIKDERAFDAVLAEVGAPLADPAQRPEALDALSRMGYERAFERLIRHLHWEDAHQSWNAALALGALNDPRAFEPLAEQLKSSDNLMRVSAAQGLGYLKDRRAVEPLLALAKDADRSVRYEALRALKAFDDPRGGALYESYMRAQGADADERWRRRVAEAARDYRRVIAEGLEGTEGPLVEALEKRGTRAMAEAFLNSGHPALESAAKRWAAEHGYEIQSGGERTPKWGSMRNGLTSR